MKFYIPKQMADNAAQGLYLVRENGRGGTEVGRRMARRILKAYRDNRPVSADTIKRINNYFPRHQFDNLDQKTPYPSNGWIAWNLWGGYFAWDYTQRLRAQYVF
jgi:hypothetical protein